MTLRTPRSREESKASLEKCTSSLPHVVFGSTKERLLQLKKYSSGLATSCWAAEHTLTLSPQEAEGSWDQSGPKLSAGVPCPGNSAQSFWVGAGVPQSHTALPTHSQTPAGRGHGPAHCLYPRKPLYQTQDPNSWGLGSETPPIHIQDISSISPKVIKPAQWDSCVDCRLPSITYYERVRILPQGICPKTQMFAEGLFLILTSLSRHFHQKASIPSTTESNRWRTTQQYLQENNRKSRNLCLLRMKNHSYFIWDSIKPCSFAEYLLQLNYWHLQNTVHLCNARKWPSALPAKDWCCGTWHRDVRGSKFCTLDYLKVGFLNYQPAIH